MTRPILATWPTVRRGMFHAALALARYLPYPLMHLAAKATGSVGWWLDAAGRRRVTRNLAPMLPVRSEALARCVRRSYDSFFLNTAEVLRIDRLPGWFLDADHLRLIDPWGVFAVRPRPGPTIVVTTHGHHELLLAAAARLDLAEQVQAVSLPQSDPLLDDLYDRLRGAVRCRSLRLDRAPLAALRALRDGLTLGILADRDYTGNGLEVRAAGRQWRVPAGPAALAVQTGAPIVPLLLIRTSPTAFALVVAKPLWACPGAVKNLELERLTRAMAASLLRLVSTAPGQWLTFHSLWRDPISATSSSSPTCSPQPKRRNAPDPC